MSKLNPTQGALLGFLYERPRTGWDLIKVSNRGLAKFWNITQSHIYRELKVLETQGHIHPEAVGAREKQPYKISRKGRAAFRKWLSTPPGPEQLRFPLLVKLWFGRHLAPAEQLTFLEACKSDHEMRLSDYVSLLKQPDLDEQVRIVVDFGVAYETAVLNWINDSTKKLRQ